jgi:hypothetical protein
MPSLEVSKTAGRPSPVKEIETLMQMSQRQYRSTREGFIIHILHVRCFTFDTVAISERVIITKTTKQSFLW